MLTLKQSKIFKQQLSGAAEDYMSYTIQTLKPDQCEPKISQTPCVISKQTSSLTSSAFEHKIKVEELERRINDLQGKVYCLQQNLKNSQKEKLKEKLKEKYVKK